MTALVSLGDWWAFVRDRSDQILINAYGHAVLVFAAVLIGSLIAIAVAVLVVRRPGLEPIANAISSIGLTLPSFALVGLMIAFVGLGFAGALLCVTFYAIFPVLRNAVVGLRGVDATLIESARGMGLTESATLMKVRLPLAWPVILAGVRVSTQMSMGVATIAAYLLGPGFGSMVFTGLTQAGGKNGENYVLTGTVGVVILALVFDLVLLAVGKLTISKGIRVA
ncbi:ABC transporter permease [Alteromonas gracilis]